MIKKTTTNKFVLIDAIKRHPLWKKGSSRDKLARNMLDEAKNADKSITSKNYIVPGQLVIFKYLNPISKDELEYYDASPCTIFFSIFMSSKGKRVLGFNLHYFPPQLRFQIMNKIFELYRPIYNKYFKSGLSKDIDAFDYQYLMEELNRHNLAFAVREYIPSLIGDTYIIPPEHWATAMFTEGWFKKDTRAHILTLFKGDAKSKGKISVGSHSKGKKHKNKTKIKE